MKSTDYTVGNACPNCSAVLTGPYCAQCGQHAHSSARGLSALLHDGWETLTHVDGRFWCTFGTLLFRPGQLTLEYFRDRRARYIPPVRLYLIMSLVFFAAVGIGGNEDGGKPAVKVSPVKQGQTLAEACDEFSSSVPELASLLRRSCLQSLANHGEGFTAAMQRNVPRMMFIFLPLLAFFMTLFYWRPRRLYLQQLVFFLHTHAALFAVFFMAWLMQWLGGLAAWLETLYGLMVLASIVYAVWYIYRALRRVYGQSRGITLCKLTLLSVAYGICLAVLLVLTVLISAVAA